MASDPNQKIEKTTVEARQGSTRPRVIYVLVAALVLVVVVFAITGVMQHH